MKECLIDTDILSYFLKGSAAVNQRFSEYLNYYPTLKISILTHYEIKSGLRFKDARKQLRDYENFSSKCEILPLTELSTDISASLYAKLRRKGTPVDDIDLLIAGIAIENELVLVTNNQKHFVNIAELQTENWLTK